MCVTFEDKSDQSQVFTKNSTTYFFLVIFKFHYDKFDDETKLDSDQKISPVIYVKIVLEKSCNKIK